MSCLKPHEMQRFIDEEMVDPEKRKFEIHLGECHHCQDALQVYRQRVESTKQMVSCLDKIPSRPLRLGGWTWVSRPVEVPAGVLLLVVGLLLGMGILLVGYLYGAPEQGPAYWEDSVSFVKVSHDGVKRVARPVDFRGYRLLSEPKIYVFKEEDRGIKSIL